MVLVWKFWANILFKAQTAVNFRVDAAVEAMCVIPVLGTDYLECLSYGAHKRYIQSRYVSDKKILIVCFTFNTETLKMENYLNVKVGKCFSQFCKQTAF